MKGFVAMFALLATVLAVIAFAVVELLIKLLPWLVAAAGVWLLVRFARGRARHRADDDRLCQLWGVERVAPPASAGLPAVFPHRERIYVVRGDDTGLLADRDDGYVRVSAQALPRVQPARVSQQRRRFVPRRRAPQRGRRRP